MGIMGRSRGRIFSDDVKLVGSKCCEMWFGSRGIEW